MAPKQKVSKDMVLKTAVDVVRENGECSLNARSVAKKLGCSTQPIFSNYSNMSLLKKDVIRSANEIYQEYLNREMKGTDSRPYRASGIAYIRFAVEEKELFKLLFMRDRSGEQITQEEEKENMVPILALISKSMGLDLDEAYMFHVEMWLYVHGIATTIATSYLKWDWELINRILTDAYESMRDRYLKKGDM